MERLLAGVFALSLGFLAYLYGAASARFELFPYPLVEDAFSAAGALAEVWREETDAKPPGALKFEAAAAPPQLHGPPADDGLILITGGPYQRLDLCPELGCIAWLMDRAGEVKHVWPIDPAEPWADLSKVRGFTQVENVYPQGLHLFDNGDLLVSYQAWHTFPFSVGLAKFDRDGHLLWKHENLAHHWFEVADDGRIYLPAHDFIDGPLAIPGTINRLTCDQAKTYEDLILVLAPDGRVERRISVLESLLDSGWGALVYMTLFGCDPLHLNDVRVLSAADAPAYPGFAAGDLLISMNTINAVAVLDGETAATKWLLAGQTYKQHAPRWLGDGRILVLDNLGGRAEQGGTRIVAIDIPSRAVRDVFPRADTPPEVDFFTSVAGHIDLAPDRRRALFSLTTQGRVLEVDLETGEVLWTYQHVFDLEGRAEGEAGERYARFNLTGAYYAGRPAFLTAPSS